MKHALKLSFIVLAASFSLPGAQAEIREPVEIEFTYDRTLPAAQTYRRAKWTAQKACGLNGRVAPMKKLLAKSCVAPALADFVAKTGNRELMAYHARQRGRSNQAVTFAKN